MHIPGMVRIDGGRFLMGRNDGPDPEAAPAHEMHIAPFYLDETPVTNQRYLEFLRSSKGFAAPQSGNLDAPVTNVTWDEAYAYCLAQGKRLPTEAEWEFAAKGVDGRLYPWGEVFDQAAVNYGGSRLSHPERVAARARNRSPFGVADMAGNVWQWCADDYHHYPGRKPMLTVPPGAKVIRGGSLQSEPWQVTTIGRNLELPSKRSPVIGFRCAK
jgi:formylglycine-generating enzyme required for sulfatase activity